MFESVPNFPEIITKEMIIAYAQASPFGDFWDLPYGERWMVYARKLEGWTHWEVDIVEDGHWILGFVLPNPGDGFTYAFNVHSAARPYSRHVGALVWNHVRDMKGQENTVRWHFPERRYGTNKDGVFIYPRPVYGIGGFQGYAGHP